MAVRGIPCLRAANYFQLVQSLNKVSLLRDRNHHVWVDGLDFATSLHPAEALLGNPSSKKVEHFNLSLESSPLAQLKQPHLDGIVTFPVVVADGDGGLHRLAKEVDHLPSSNCLAKFLQAGW